MAVRKNELVWSHSRHRTLASCARAYWSTYYGSWEGWKPNAAPEQRQLWVQKKLSSVPLWIGTTVHHVAEHLLKKARNGEVFDEEEELDLVVDVASREIRDSESGLAEAFPSQHTFFQEHYYGVETDWDAAVDEIESQVKTLLENKIFRRLLEVPERILEVEELKRFGVGEDEVWVSLDVLVQDGQGGAVIIDWKTGEQHQEEVIHAQLGVYGLYTSQNWNIPEDKLQAMHVNLRYNTQTRHPVGKADIQIARETIQSSMAHMRSLVTPDNIAQMADFAMLPEGHERCQTCGFRRSCLRG